ncbi:Mur ligase family protein [Yunchengibacter salinarum]|uniref:Mur ligase family protein n=1 Tax=Yunchengibacter salinarum TaxID=3133399 RepID=UPI0035B5E90E
MIFDPANGLILLVAAALGWLLLERALLYMTYFQQEEYDTPRFLGWMWRARAVDSRTTLALLTLAAMDGLVFLALKQHPTPFTLALAAVIPALAAHQERARRRGHKKPLALTQRVRRILGVHAGLMLALVATAYPLVLQAPTGTRLDLDLSALTMAQARYDWRGLALIALMVALIQLTPLMLVVANRALAPLEAHIRAGFRREAEDRLARLNPTVIGITGSFGKTSTKHILAHILSSAAPTLATPGSVNTDMGITRIIREKLTGEHRYFIVEMGAYGPGSIARLCRLTPPDTGIITAVGPAHYERFKTLDAVARTKFELAEAVFQSGGRMVVNRSGIPADLLEDRLDQVRGDYVMVAIGPDEGGAHVTLTDHHMTPDGLNLTLIEKAGTFDTDGATHTLTLPLFGSHQAGNAAAAIALARSLGMPMAAIKAAIADMPQINHRLAVIRAAGQPTIIDDAYNSNPVGFEQALTVLDFLAHHSGGRRILITPGMVELGARHDEDHARLGHFAAGKVDLALVVTPQRIPSFVDALKAASGGATVLTFDRQQEAESWAANQWRPEDVVLFENNLPDLFESRLSL